MQYERNGNQPKRVRLDERTDDQGPEESSGQEKESVMQRTIKNVVLLGLAALMSLTVLFALAGCGKSDEEVIRTGLTSELDKFKDPTSDSWADLSNNGEFASMGLSDKDVVSAWVEGFDYTIDSVTVTGSTAEVKVSITCKQLNPVISTMTDKVQNDESFVGLTQEEAIRKAGEVFLADLRAAQTATTQITIPCVKSGDTWTEGAGAISAYQTALLGTAAA
ncbi:MAG: hypothetical protein LBU31_04090 [Coriobacteriales bacterium]|nr:hypothetical protein [Coriobacteriales bacterium]